MAHNYANMVLMRQTLALINVEGPVTDLLLSEALGAILAFILRAPNGASLQEIDAAFGKLLSSRRTLQRRLADLVAHDYLHVKGEKKGTRYYATEKAQRATESNGSDEAEPAGEFPLSSEARILAGKVRRPRDRRAPVPYERSFLDRYQPNHSGYLSPGIREHLRQVGTSPVKGRPAGTYARQIMHRLLIDLAWNSSRLEGNTYSLLDTERLLRHGETAAGKDAFETQMIRNHKEAIEFLVEAAADIGWNRYTILNLHALLSDNLLPDPAASGRLRTLGVGITGSVYEPLGVPQLIEESFDAILAKANAIQDPFEQAFFAMVHLPYLQPFEDVNKRVSRLAANIPLIKENLCPLSFIDVPADLYVSGTLAIYELNRIELLRDVFVWAYERSAARYAAVRQSLGDPEPFRMRYTAQLKDVVAEIVRQRVKDSDVDQFVTKWNLREVRDEDQKRFRQVVAEELESLHEGNFARYRLRPSEFQAWRFQRK